VTDPDLTGIDIDTSRPVFVTGSTGYVAGWIVKGLLDAGATVHAAVRDPGNAAKVAHLVEAAESAPGTHRHSPSREHRKSTLAGQATRGFQRVARLAVLARRLKGRRKGEPRATGAPAAADAS